MGFDRRPLKCISCNAHYRHHLQLIFELWTEFYFRNNENVAPEQNNRDTMITNLNIQPAKPRRDNATLDRYAIIQDSFLVT